MPFDAIAALRAAGNPVDSLSAEQKSVLATLSEDEVRTLTSVQAKLDAVSGDVEAHAFGNNVF